MHLDGPRPVEFKNGRRKSFENDNVQLCAQAFCLEEMFGVTVAEGFIYYAASKRRRPVTIDARLRAETERTIERVRTLLMEGYLPPAVLLPRCDGCSLRAVCLPELTANAQDKQISYMQHLWED
ncbi:MAG: CRISPR-associated protein Cas4 [Armatimonadota bacterium]